MVSLSSETGRAPRMITITPLGQAIAPSVTSPSSPSSSSALLQPKHALAYLVRIDNSFLLLDCGAPEDFRFPVRTDSPVSRELVDYELADGQLDTEAISRLPLDDAIQLIAPRVQLVLLSHSTIHHVGLYAYAKARLGLHCPAYAALPTASMGRLVTLEAAVTISNESDLRRWDKRPLPNPEKHKIGGIAALKAESFVKNETTPDRDQFLAGHVEADARDQCVPVRSEIDEAFEDIRTVRYLQPTVLDGALSSVSLTAHSAGHTLGGTVWKLRSPTSGTVVLAIDWNHVRERHIDGSGVIEGAAVTSWGPATGSAGATNTGASARAGEEAAGTKRAEMLVTSGERIGKVNARRKDKDKRLLEMIHKTLTIAKSTLHLPLDASPRLLEALILLDQHWAYAYPHARFPLCLVSKTGKEVLERARTMREWMSRHLQGEEGSTTNQNRGSDRAGGGAGAIGLDQGPLEFRYLRIFTSLQALAAAVPSESAKVVITVGPSLLYGPSLRFFRENVASSSASTIVLTQRLQEGSLGARLLSWWEEGQDPGWSDRIVGREVDGLGRKIEGLTIRAKVPLQGAELEEYLEEERLKKEREEQQKVMLARSRKRLEADQDGGDDDDDEENDDDVEDSEEEDDDAEAAVAGFGGPNSRKRKRRMGATGGASGEAGLMSGNNPRSAPSCGDADDDGALISHDVYLRGLAAQMTNFFGSGQRHRQQLVIADGANVSDARREDEAAKRHGVGHRFRTFPVVEKRKRVDAFGEVIDVARWLSRGRLEKEEEEKLKDATGSHEMTEGSSLQRKRGRQDPEEEDDELAGVPSKYVSDCIAVQVHCRILFIDLEGLIDGRALGIVLPQLAPRRLVLVNTPQPLPVDIDVESAVVMSKSATATATQHFIASLLAVRDFTREIAAPALGACVSVGAQVRSFDVRLGEGVLESIEMSSYEEWALGWVSGRVSTGAKEVAAARALQSGNGASAITVISLERAIGAAINENEEDGRDAAQKNEDAGDNAAVSAAAAGVARGDHCPDRTVYRPMHAAGQDSLRGDKGEAGSRQPTTLFIGDVRLSKLKAALAAGSYRIPAEFGGSGVLVCGSAALSSALGSGVYGQGTQSGGMGSANQASAAVTVQKSGDRIIIEGNAGRTFIRVREAVYAMHARVGAGDV